MVSTVTGRAIKLAKATVITGAIVLIVTTRGMKASRQQKSVRANITS